MVIISKQLVCQKFIFKIHSERLRKEKWNLTLPLGEARRNEEVISLADSQMLRWIDELNGVVDANEQARMIKTEIASIKKNGNAPQNKREIRKLYSKLDELQFKADYMCLIIDKVKDYYRACKGFKINGIRYKRLLGTNGGIKNSTIVFVSERLSDELIRRCNNDRDMSVPLVTAKLEAYKALTCSASNPVSFPRGILIVNDAETTFLSDIIYLNDESPGEPVMEYKANQEILLNATDGFGLMHPKLAARWSEELGLDYLVGGVNTRFSFEKGMVYTFDFIEFAEKVAGKYTVIDAWGNEKDIRDVEIVLTTSMVKLWDSYKSCEEYINASLRNGYSFGISKTCPRELESRRNLNYQFIQSYDLTDDDIDKLIEPTMREFRDVLSDDWKSAVLFLRGFGLNENNIDKLDNDFVKAMMIDRRVLDDPFVQHNIYKLIKNRINEAKVGVVGVHGNYSMISGDPYLLCQSIFGLEKTGLLKSGEIYNKYWADSDSDILVCFRAPMTCHNNIRLVKPVRDDASRYWYRYMNTSTVFNSWDTAGAALNGADFDGDMVMLTDNEILIKKHKTLPALMCVQRKAEKVIQTEESFIKSNIESFGNEIGETTNRITSMFEVQSRFEKGSKEYETLEYRIRCGQLYQQNSIDKAKGIICKPMPKSWYDRHSVNKIEDEDKKEFYRSIVAERKPYFMRYIYPSLSKQYNTFIKNTNRNALREFQMTVQDLLELDESSIDERQKNFLTYYHYRMPVGIGECVMNKICRKFEAEFDGFIGKSSTRSKFDYSIFKSGRDYTKTQFNSLKKVYEDYNKRLKNYSIYADYERVDECDASAALAMMNEDFKKECEKISPDEETLCDILLDICYRRNHTKRFVWNMCGNTIIHNLLKQNNNIISFPCIEPNGEFSYGGERFTVKEKEIKEADDNIG